MLARFANPHHTAQSFEITARSTLYPQNETEEAEADPTLLKDLNTLVKRNLGEFTIEPPKKRRKVGYHENADVQMHGEIVACRLVSTRPPRSICLDPKPPPEVIVWEPRCEDDDSEAETRRRNAEAAAVDLSWLSLESQKTYVPRPNEQRKIITASAHIPLSPPPIALIQLPANSHTPHTSLQKIAGSDASPSPHETSLKGDYCPVVSAELFSRHAEPKTKNSKTKRRKKLADRPPARFWRPLRGWGGKSPGYAFGYEGSWAADDESELHEARYFRDRMKKGVPVDVEARSRWHRHARF